MEVGGRGGSGGLMLHAACFCKSNFIVLQPHPLIYMWSVGTFVLPLAELSSCDREHMAHSTENIYHLALCRKSLQNPPLEGN